MTQGSMAYAVAIVAVAVCGAAQLALAASAPATSPFLLFFAAVLAASWYGGFLPGLVATGLAALLCSSFFLPDATLGLGPDRHLVATLIFVVEGAVISYVAASMRTAQQRLAAALTDRARAERSALEAAELLETVNRVGRRVGAELELDPLVQAVTDAATSLTRAQFGAFFYNSIGENGEAYTLYSISGVAREAFARFPLPRNTDLFGPTFRGEGVVRIDDVKQDPRYGRNEPYNGMPPGHLPVTSYLSVPVVSRTGEVFGGLFFGHAAPGMFSERDERVVTGLAAQAAVAMDNSRLFEAQRSARQEAERANRAKDEFLSVLSHELRTPLSSMLNWLHVLRRAPSLAPARVGEALASMERSARAQARLIEDLLDISRIVAGRLRVEHQAIEPLAVVRSAIEAVRPSADAKGIRIEQDLAPEPLMIAADPDRLQQAISNLMGNAVKFTPNGGRLRIDLRADGSQAEIVVEDTGRGIAPEFLSQIFGRFVQAAPVPQRGEGGLGLGLAIARYIVEMHGGSITAASDGVGHGARFTVRLPRLDGLPVAAPPSPVVYRARAGVAS